MPGKNTCDLWISGAARRRSLWISFWRLYTQSRNVDFKGDGCTVRRNREPLAVDLKFELILDEPKFFREMKIGCWRWVHDYESGEGTWYWEGRQPREISRSPASGEAAKDMQSPPAPLLVRRSRVSLL